MAYVVRTSGAFSVEATVETWAEVVDLAHKWQALQVDMDRSIERPASKYVTYERGMTLAAGQWTSSG